MKQLPTAEEFLIRQGCQRMDCEGEDCDYFEDVQPKDLIEFAKLYVQSALESAAENSEVKVVYVTNDQPSSSFGDDYTHVVDKQSILNAYPLYNIK